LISIIETGLCSTFSHRPNTYACGKRDAFIRIGDTITATNWGINPRAGVIQRFTGPWYIKRATLRFRRIAAKSAFWTFLGSTYTTQLGMLDWATFIA
jgi:hypothetical protein